MLVGSRLVFHRHGVVGLVGPLAQVDGVRSPVEQPGAGVEVVISAPAAAHVLAVVGAPGGRAEPEIPVDHVALAGSARPAARRFELRRIDRCVQRVDLAELAALGQVDRLLEIGDAAALRAGLEDAPGGLDGVGQLLTIGDRQAAGLLAVDVLAGLRGQDRCRRVPAVAGGDQHRVDVLAREQFAEIAIEHAILVAVMLIDQGLAGVPTAGLHVGDRHALHVRQTEHGLQVVGAAGTDADHAERDLFAGRRRAVQPQDARGHDHRSREGGTRRHRAAQKVATRGARTFIHGNCPLLGEQCWLAELRWWEFGACEESQSVKDKAAAGNNRLATDDGRISDGPERGFEPALSSIFSEQTVWALSHFARRT